MKKIALARALRRQSTSAECVVWSWIRNERLHVKFRRQHPIGPYIADFYCAELRLVIEIDGGVHDTFSHQKRDVYRSNALESHGYRVIRIRNEAIIRRRDDAWATLIKGVVNAVMAKTGRSEIEVLRWMHSQPLRKRDPSP